jgi:hypothetical protein
MTVPYLGVSFLIAKERNVVMPHYKRHSLRIVLGALAKSSLQKWPIRFSMCIRPHTTRKPLNGFSLNLVLKNFAKIVNLF